MAASKVSKEQLLNDCIEHCKSSKNANGMESAQGMGVGIWDTILQVALPLLLEAFQKCTGNKAKKAAMIDDEQRRISLIKRHNRAERKAHKFADKVLSSKAVVDANGGNLLTDEVKDEVYEAAVQYSFENRDAVAAVAAKK